MHPLLFDECVPPQVADALRNVDFETFSIGDDHAPERGATDEENVRWCRERGAVLITKDWGRKNKVILDLLASHQVHAIFVPESLNKRPGKQLLRALLSCEEQLESLLSGKKTVRHRVNKSGTLKPLGR